MHHETGLDRRISDWTGLLTREEVMVRLQQEGVPAGIVQKSGDLYQDPQLEAYAFFEEVDHPVIGRHRIETHAFRFSKTPRKIRMPAPCMGQHTECVCREILGFSDDQFVDLLVDGVFE